MDSFRAVLNNISKEEIIKLLEKYDEINTYNFENFYRDNNKNRGKENLYE
ncbi:hypothetical protein [Clostridium botulinum]|nr:hypothetical protein [Clostridium botulinum]